MDVRHLRYFITVAEELHFSRAAERLHIEQSPLSRAIKHLESELGVILFERPARGIRSGIRLTWAGQVFLEDARHVLLYLDQAKAKARAAATGYRGTLRIALSDGIARNRLTALLALCREEEPDVEIRLFEVPLSQQLKGLRSDLYDAGFALADAVKDGIVAEPVWRDSLMVAVPSRHPLLAHKRVPLRDVLNYPLVLCDPEVCKECSQLFERLLGSVDAQPIVAERVATYDLMLALVAAGYGVGFSSAAYSDAYRHKDVVVRPLAGGSLIMTTYLLRPDNKPSEPLRHFIRRVNQVGA